MDVCKPGALSMHRFNPPGIEGEVFSYLSISSEVNLERALPVKMSFPYLQIPGLCDGCSECVNECPASALLLESL